MPDHILAQRGALATSRSLARTILAVLFAIVVLYVSAKIRVPFWPVPATLQTLAVLLIGASLGARLGSASVLLYLLLGLVGLPVFTNTPPVPAGPIYFLGPTAGYLAAMPLAAAIAGWAGDRPKRLPLPGIWFALLVADAIVLLSGALWLGAFARLPSGTLGVGLERALELGVIPFLLAEFVKVSLATALVAAARRWPYGQTA